MEQDLVIRGIYQAVIDGDEEAAHRWARTVLQERIDPLRAIQEGLQKALTFVGERFRTQEIFIPELVMAGETAKIISDTLAPELEKSSAAPLTLGMIILGSVAGDLHDIGKNLVGTLCRAAGFAVVDVGIDVSADRFVEVVREKRPNILGLSALLSTTIREQKVVIEALREAGLRSQVKVMVGGGAVTRIWAQEIGADAFGEDAADAVEQAKRLMGLS